MAHYEIQMDEEVEYGATGGPMFKTKVFVTSGGYEFTNQDWEDTRGEWDLRHGLKTTDQLAAIKSLFMQMRGRRHSFNFKDWSDYKSWMFTETAAPATGIKFGDSDVAENVQNGSNTDFQLTKWYPDDVTDASATIRYYRRLYKPVISTLSIWKNGSPLSSPGDYQVTDADNGLITFTVAPGGGDVLRWEGDFFVPVRFDSDWMPTEIEFFERMNYEFKIVEKRL